MNKHKHDRRHPGKKMRRSSRSEGGPISIDSISAIKEYLRYKPNAITALRVQERMRKQVEAELRDLLNKSQKNLAPALDEDPALVAEITLDPGDFDETMRTKDEEDVDIILALDHIEDPRNVGAIVRSAAFFGIKTILAPQDRQAHFTQASVSTSMGGFALVDLVVVTNLSQALKKCKDHGYWIVCADMDGEPIEGVARLHKKVVIVLGSEEKGVSRNIREGSDHTVAIRGSARAVESLNVSVAAGILIERFMSQQSVFKLTQT